VSYATLYLNCFDPDYQADAVAWVLRQLRTGQFEAEPLTHDDAIAFRGQSGASVAFPVSALTGIPLAHVRKPECSSHVGGNRQVVGNSSPIRYVIVDDFIDTGDTIRAIYEGIHREFPAARCVGILLYGFSADPRTSHITTARWPLQVQQRADPHYALPALCDPNPPKLADEIAAWSIRQVR